MELAATSAIRNYKAALASARAEPRSPGTVGEAAGHVLRDFTQTLQEAETAARASMVSDADPHALVTALAQSELAVETAVTVRNKVVEAYQEILRMPV